MKICVTGLPCSGKTTAMQYIKEAGYNTFIADEYVRSIYKVNKPGYKAIKKAFGSKYVTSMEVDRKALGKLVFQDKKALVKLNKIMNPLIAKAIKQLDNKKT
ncbi:MAG: dephospho-CoA kinase [Mycoplasmoidaceae bacterium]|nr:dephospho-CoA kinase [Mycoplasmoidaceae bacterium]